MYIWESFSVADRGKPTFGATNSFFTLGASVGPDQPNQPEDVIKVETILGNTGDHDLVRTDGPTGFWSPDKENAVRSWQAKNGLKVDGLLKPNGPTITSLKQATGSVLGGFIPPTPQDVDQHHAQRAQDEPGILNLRRARLSFPTPSQKLELDEASRAFNADSARALSRSSVDGDIPRIYADYVKQAGIAESHPTIMDLAEQMNAKVGRDRTDRVLHGIVGQLPADQAKELLGGAVPAERPLGVKVADLSDDHDQPLFRTAANQYAKADTGPLNDAAPDVLSPPAELPQGTEKPANDGGGSKPVQTAMAPAVAAGAVALGGLTAGILGEKLPEAMEKTRKWWENQTTTVDPEAGKPQVLTGPDPSKPQIPQAIPPSTPPQQVPPLPPSTAQKPSQQGANYPGQPAEPVKPMGPLETGTLKPDKQLDHATGAPPHPSTTEGLDKTIPDPELRSKVLKGKILTGKTTAVGQDGVVVDAGSGGAAQAQKEFEQDAASVGAKIKDIPGMPGGKSYDDPKTGQSGSYRPSSTKEGRPTAETTYTGKDGRKFTVKRRH